MIRAWAFGAVAALVLALAGALWVQAGRLDATRAEAATLRASVAAMKLERDLAREAQAVADAYRRTAEARAREYDTLREGMLRDGEDADLPDWLRDALVRLRTGADGADRRAGHPE